MLNKLAVTFSSETMEARRQWVNVFKMSKEKSYHQKILHATKLSVRNGVFENQTILNIKTPRDLQKKSSKNNKWIQQGPKI